MTISSDAARRAALEAARRAAEAAARRAAEAAAKRAAEQAAKKAAQAAAKKAAEAAAKKQAQKTKPPTKTFQKDELSQGMGRALRERATHALGATGLSSAKALPGADATAKSAAAAKAALARMSPAERAKTDVVFMKDTRPGTPVDSGKLLFRRDGRFTDPVENKSYTSLKKFDADGAYAPAGTVKAKDLQAAMSAPSGSAAQRAAFDRLHLGGTAKALLDADVAPAQAPTPKTPGERASELYEKELKGLVEKPLSQWTHADAKAFTDGLASAAEANRDDPAMVRSLMTLSQDRLKRSGELLGAATDEKFEREDVEGIASNLARLAEVAPEDAAARLAYGVAQEINDDSELHYVDDGLDAFMDGGSKFRGLLAGALEAQGKSEAMDELVTQHEGGLGGLVDTIYDNTVGRAVDAAEFFGDLAGEVGDAAGAAWDFGGSVVGSVVDGGKKLIGAAADFAIDTAKGTISVIGDAASMTLDAVKEGVQWAAEKGLELAGPLLNKARDLFKDAVTGALKIDEKVDRLQPGDTFTVGGGVEVTAGVDVEVSADLQVKRNEDGSYTVSAGVDGKVGLEALAGADVGAGGKVEFRAETAEEAKKLAESLAMSGAAAAAAGTPPFNAVAPLLAPSPSDLSYMKDHLSAIEVSASVSAGVDASLEAGGVKLSAGAAAEGEVAYRIEFNEDGTKDLVRKQTIEGTVSGDATAQLLGDGVTGSLPAGELSGRAALEVETRVKLPDSLGDVKDLPAAVALLTDQSGAISRLMPGAQTKITGTIGGEVKVGDVAHGGEISIEASGLDVGDAIRVGRELVSGDPRGALRELPDVKLEGYHYQTTGFDFEGGLEVAGQGVSVDLHNTIKDRQGDFEVTI
ncbi:MAG: hypothetical protein AMXMBFR34_17790 [Myxococcaceae bacterium]